MRRLADDAFVLSAMQSTKKQPEKKRDPKKPTDWKKSIVNRQMDGARIKKK